MPGRIFQMDDEGLSVNDVITCDLVEISPESHILSLGEVGTDYEFYLMEVQQMVRIDNMDTAILEICSVEIA